MIFWSYLKPQRGLPNPCPSLSSHPLFFSLYLQMHTSVGMYVNTYLFVLICLCICRATESRGRNYIPFGVEGKGSDGGDLWNSSLIGAADTSNKPLKVRFGGPAKHWSDAVPIGNGRLGAMIWGGVANETLNLNGTFIPLLKLITSFLYIYIRSLLFIFPEYLF